MMPKKIIINECAARKILNEEFLEKKDLKKYVDTDKDFERRIKSIISASVNDLFRILWQRRNIYDSELKH